MPEMFVDLHIHSCLSPCGDADMTPGNILGMAALKGLDAVAIADHNSALNLPAAQEIAGAYGVRKIGRARGDDPPDAALLVPIKNKSA